MDAHVLNKPRRVRREKAASLDPNVVDVGPGTKWQLPFKKKDIDALVSSESDIAAAVNQGGWKAGALILYRDYLREESLDPTELRILGSLMEKQLSTPEYYPLTLNALVAAANQKSNREPVMELSDSDVQRTTHGHW